MLGRYCHDARVSRSDYISIIPPTCVERMSLVTVDAGDSRKLGPIEWSVGHDHEPGPYRVVAVGRDDPSILLLAPADFFYFGLKARVAV